MKCTKPDLPRPLYRAEFGTRLLETAPELSKRFVNQRKLFKLELASKLTIKPEKEAVSHLIMKSIYPLHSFILPHLSFWRTNHRAPTCSLVDYTMLPEAKSSQWWFFTPLQHP